MTNLINEKIESMILLLDEMQEDSTVPRNVKSGLQSCSNALREECEISLKIDKVRHVLEGISDDSNLEAYTRTQLWSIAGMLEKF